MLLPVSRACLKLTIFWADRNGEEQKIAKFLEGRFFPWGRLSTAMASLQELPKSSWDLTFASTQLACTNGTLDCLALHSFVAGLLLELAIYQKVATVWDRPMYIHTYAM